MKSEAYIWFDAEFSSLDLEQASLLQVAAIITDRELRPLDEHAVVDWVIKIEAQTEVSPWVATHLSELVNRCRSAEALDVEAVDRLLDQWVSGYFPEKQSSFEKRPILAGNSIHNDWWMVRRHLPLFASQLHYRLLDVSTLKTLWVDASPHDPFNKEDKEMLERYGIEQSVETLKPHDALFDIQASIAELAYYRHKMGWTF